MIVEFGESALESVASEVNTQVKQSAPRARGDVPGPVERFPQPARCSPRPRGCSQALHPLEAARRLLPAPAGMFPMCMGAMLAVTSAPRARGDVPPSASPEPAAADCSPRPRGCSPQRGAAWGVTSLLPAPAGMFPCGWPAGSRKATAPRARGDVPVSGSARQGRTRCSPRPRGCSRLRVGTRAEDVLLPAPAGMFPASSVRWSGGVSAPRARGDVPMSPSMPPVITFCSPRPRGCSRGVCLRGAGDALLPAPAGMFPSPCRQVSSTPAAPRARGDVPEETASEVLLWYCSPRPRGCSRHQLRRDRVALLLPAPAGMFPRPGTR
ncbi:hypothetical protein OK006_6796 [Actinobacteria bacterium OK006]|nr:hypothetical protein OK006_6796 [Actinobacteria bacterium OK006]